jgi:membrane-associated protease RseP (regulator of RpoE activity)
VRLRIRRRGEDQDRSLPESGEILPVYQADRGFAVLGLAPPAGDHIRLVLGTSGSPANLEPGERVAGIGGAMLPREEPDRLMGQEIHERLLPYLGREVALTLEKDGRTREARVKYAGDALEPSLTGFPTVIDSVIPGQPAEKAGVRGGDIILAVDGQSAFELKRCIRLLHEDLDAGKTCRLALWRPNEAGGERIEVELAGERVEGGRQQIGIKANPLDHGRMPPLPALEDGSESPLQAAKVHEGDTIVAIILPTAEQLKAAAKSEASTDAGGITLAVLGGGQRVLVPVPKAALEAADKVQPVPTWARWFGSKPKPSLLRQLFGTRVETGSLAPGFVRVTPADGSAARDLDLRDLERDAPGFTASLQPGDWIVGRTPTDKGPAVELLRGASGSPELRTYDPGVAFAFDIEEVPYQLSSWREAFAMVDATSYNMVVKTLQLIPRFFRSADQGGIDPNKSLTGPVGMFRLLKVKAEQFGMASYLKFLALMGLNLFLVNLLPIPITDGGQLLILGIETAVRRPLPATVRNLLQWAGFILVVGLMLYVLGLDLSRL